MGTDQVLDCVGRGTINEVRRWRRLHRRGQQTLVHRLELGDMEGRMYPHGAWELKPDCHWTDYPLYREGNKELGHPFPGLPLEW